MLLPDYLEHLLREVRRDRRACPLAFKHDLDEFGLVFSLIVKREPVIEIFRAYSPTVGDPLGRLEGHIFDFLDKDCLGSSQRKIVLFNEN